MHYLAIFDNYRLTRKNASFDLHSETLQNYFQKRRYSRYMHQLITEVGANSVSVVCNRVRIIGPLSSALSFQDC